MAETNFFEVSRSFMRIADHLKKGTEFLRGGGETGALMRAHDWPASILGPPETWPHSLRVAVQIILNSRYPMFVWWGPQLINFYNDSYVPFLGHRHPRALGIPAQESWREIWDVIGPQVDQVMKEGRSTWNEEKLLVMERYGYREETYFTWSYSPLPDDHGGIGGVFCAVTEDTTRVVGQRRIRVLRSLGAHTASARSVEQACEIAAAAMAENVNDLPFGMIYLVDGAEKQARLACSFGLDGYSQFRPETVSLSGPGPWPLDSVVQSGEMEIVSGIELRFGEIKDQPWPEPISTAVVQPFARQGASTPAGFIVAGTSPRLKLDDDYRGFFGLLASQVAATIANADAYQEERRRAEALAEIDRAKTTFFSNVSHEFRTPLTLMLGPLEDTLANRDGGMPSADMDRLTMAHRNGLRLLKLVNTLLDFTRIEAGRVQATYEPTDLSQLTGQLASVFRSTMEKASLRFEVECPPLTQPVFIDRDMWEKIVLNLIANAFKFTFAGEVSVRLQEADGQAILSVADTGTGIPDEELPRVFERFHRVEGASGRTHEGTGIGLALVQELVRLHGGSVKVESVLGQGSTFTISIPMGSSHLPQERVSRKADGESTPLFESYIDETLAWTLSSSGRGEKPVTPTGELATVLLADDNADMRDYVSKLLSQQYRVISVGNGRQALSAARTEHPDLVLTDVMMPELDGFGLLHEIRNDAKLRNIPVIMLSARAGEEARVEGLEAGADDYLVKPFTARELVARISTHISMSRLRRHTVEMEKSLRSEAERERERLRAALNASSTATFYWDVAAAEVMEYDPEALPLFGFPAQQGKLAAADFIARVHAEDRSAVAAAIEDARQGKDVDFEFRVIHPDGSLHWIHDRGKVVFKDGQAAYFVGAVTDVTERRLAHEALVQTEKLASVGRLAATVAHEINNPLESITNLIYLAKSEHQLPQNAVNYLRMADEELGRVAQLTKQTLGFYRESSGWSSFRIVGMLSQLLQVFKPKTTNKSIKIDLAVESDMEIFAVPGEMRQLFANLLNNSIDAVGEGGQIYVKVSASRRGEDGAPAVRVSVADSGPGIDPALQKKIFEPFFTTKKSVGTGLGLWICKTIVEKHHGLLQIRSSTRPERSWTVLSVLLPAGSGRPIAADAVPMKTAV
jgi:PAS domain S-box-containing protein